MKICPQCGEANGNMSEACFKCQANLKSVMGVTAVTYAPDETISVGNWIGTYILMNIPLVGLICLLVWAFGSSTPPSKQNFAKAMLILSLIGILFALFLLFISKLSS